MVGSPQGVISMQVDGASYRLHLGMSVLADVQAEHGQAFDALVAGEVKGLPDLRMVHAIFSGALLRHHPDKAADAYFVDDLIAQNPGALGVLMAASSPPADDAGGNVKGRRRA